jgi:glycylpeptide N-tetradecanoyltransferase
MALTSSSDRLALKARLNALVLDALVLARQQGFHVLNALPIMDNALFLKDQSFRRGTGMLHYYLYNYRTKFIPRGITDENKLDEERGSGVGLVLI